MCYVMGGAELPLLGEHLPEEWKEWVEVKGSTCLDYCNNPLNGRPPFVEVNGRCISEATVSKVKEAISKELNYGTY